jgi:hypothetical protein
MVYIHREREAAYTKEQAAGTLREAQHKDCYQRKGYSLHSPAAVGTWPARQQDMAKRTPGSGSLSGVERDSHSLPC